MRVKVLGTQRVDYTKKTGEQCRGVTLHVVFKDNNVVGEAVDSYFINDNLGLDCVYGVKPGDEVDIEFNRRGYPADVRPL